MHGGLHHAPVIGMWTRGGDGVASSVLLQLDGSAMGHVGYSTFGSIWLNYSAVAAGATGDDTLRFALELAWDRKTPTRLPESTWLEVRPAFPPAASASQPSATDDDAWRLHVTKLGSLIDTADVVPNGGSALHGVDPDGPVVWSRGGRTQQRRAHDAPPSSASLRIVSLDAGLVAPGNNTSPWGWDVYNAAPPDPLDGAAFNLHSNLYATNYILCYPWRPADEVGRFRFRFDVR